MTMQWKQEIKIGKSESYLFAGLKLITYLIKFKVVA